MDDIDEAKQMARNIGWLSTQPSQFAEICLNRMALRQYNPGDNLFHVDDEPGFMLFIVSGAVLVTLKHPILEPQMVHLGIRGDWLGEIAAVQGFTRRTGLEAATPLTALCLTYASTREIAAHQPGAMQNFSSLITWNYEITIRSGLDFTITDPIPRICARLLTLGGYGRNWPEDAGPVSLPITKEQLASMAAVSRNSVQRALKNLEDRGICKGQYGRITILDAVSLKQLLLSTLHQKSG